MTWAVWWLNMSFSTNSYPVVRYQPTALNFSKWFKTESYLWCTPFPCHQMKRNLHHQLIHANILHNHSQPLLSLQQQREMQNPLILLNSRPDILQVYTIFLWLDSCPSYFQVLSMFNSPSHHPSISQTIST